MKFVLYKVSKVPTFPLMSNKKQETRKMVQKLISGSAEKGKARSQGSTLKASKKAKSTQGTPGPADEWRPSTPIEKETETPRKWLRSLDLFSNLLLIHQHGDNPKKLQVYLKICYNLK